ncbi:MAG TPA: Imm63 family immunity protein [Armatimonadota bacterium]|nr:Imm63 family immunity protein [Armatimonadota bacterium]
MTLQEIETEVRQLAARIQAPENLLPSFGRHMEDAHPHIEVDARGYHYVLEERGIERARVTTHDLGELLYKIFEGVTFSMALRDERSHRVRGRDSRRYYFRRQLELLSKLCPEWAGRQAERHERILRDHPFDDAADIRADLSVEYRNQGHPPEAAWQMACEQYPLPAPATDDN